MPRMLQHRHLFSLCIVLRLRPIFLSSEWTLVICHCVFFPNFFFSPFFVLHFSQSGGSLVNQARIQLAEKFWSRWRLPVQLSAGAACAWICLHVCFSPCLSVLVCNVYVLSVCGFCCTVVTIDCTNLPKICPSLLGHPWWAHCENHV